MIESKPKSGLEHVVKQLREIADALESGPDDPPSVTPERIVDWSYGIAEELYDAMRTVERWADDRALEEAGR